MEKTIKKESLDKAIEAIKERIPEQPECKTAIPLIESVFSIIEGKNISDVGALAISIIDALPPVVQIGIINILHGNLKSLEMYVMAEKAKQGQNNC